MTETNRPLACLMVCVAIAGYNTLIDAFFLGHYLLSFCVWILNAHLGHFDLSRHLSQTFSLSKIFGRYSKTNSMPRVMGTSSAQEMRLNVLDDSIDSSGVYAIVEFTSFLYS
jgi:hypothetical protein